MAEDLIKIKESEFGWHTWTSREKREPSGPAVKALDL